MSDLISREAALSAIKSYCDGCDNYNGVRCGSCYIDSAIIAVDAVPAVDAEPVRHGKWIPVQGMRPPEYRNKKCCSVCGGFAMHDFMGRERLSFFCPRCGAKMDADIMP